MYFRDRGYPLFAYATVRLSLYASRLQTRRTV